MKTVLILTVFLSSLSAFGAQTKWSSVYTDVKKDCVAFSESNEKAEIDFYEADCKSFGGYRLQVSGGDVRYSAVLSFNGQEIAMGRPVSFHDLASDKVEWIYKITKEDDGSGKIEWMGFIYRLNVAHGDDDSRDQLYAVRLNGENSCFLGYPATNEEARALVKNASAPCR